MKLLPTFALLLACGVAQAQTTVWRCGADGRSYSDSPCDGGRVVAVVDTAAAPADAARARALAAQDRRLAQQLTDERREREARQRGNGLAGIGPAAAPPKSFKSLKPHEPRAPHLRPRSKAKPHPAATAGTSRKAARASLQTPG